MLIYFDESADGAHSYLLLSAIFNPHPKYLHRLVTEIKRKHGLVRKDRALLEIKYNYCKKERHFQAAREIVDAFFTSTSWFRCIAIEESKVDWGRFGKPYEPDKIKRARMYKKFCELLIAHNTENVYQSVLLTDHLTRCHGDEFVERMKEIFCTPNHAHSAGKSSPTIIRIEEVDSSLEQYQLLQVCDLLMGCVINNLFPTKNKYKNQIREYLVKKIGVADLLPKTWGHYSKTYVEQSYPKFNIWYWEPKNEEAQVRPPSSGRQANLTPPAAPQAHL